MIKKLYEILKACKGSNILKKGQVTIFVIIAILIVASIALFFILRDSIEVVNVPESIQPAYSHFISCVESEIMTASSVLESQGGYIELPDFEQGSSYMPFSSQLVFAGNPIPYWYYISGNNIQKEQVPTKNEMEEQLSKFIEENIERCEFGEYYEEGFEITQGEPSIDAEIVGDSIRVNLDMEMSFVKGNDSFSIENHNVEVDSNLGNLYDSAKKVYEYEQSTLFLEEYGLDILHAYAPVDGVEITCSPETWNASGVFDDLKEAIEENTMVLRNNGEDYFSVNLPVDEEVRFLNSRDWPNAFEVNPSESSLLIAEPIGNQEGLGVLGFCYAPYHFVYNMKYPVLIQIQEGDEIFQFPVSVLIESNNPRESLDAESTVSSEVELCQYKNTEVDVSVYDTSFNEVDAKISYECFGESCLIGETSSGKLRGNFPQCVNGYITASAPGYEDSRKILSTTEEGSIDILMDKNYEKEIELNVDNSVYDKEAIINFISEKGSSETVVYPEQKSISLSEGEYDIEVYIYEESEIEFEGGTKEQCVDVPRSGVGGLLGFTKEDCYEVEVPSQIISNVLSGGGNQNYYFTESELRDSDGIQINAESLPKPNSLEELQVNYLLFEDKMLEVSLI